MERTLVGFVLAVLVLATAVAFFSLNGNEEASAIGPTPTKIANDGPLGGVIDILVWSGTEATGLFHCISKTDHESSTDQIKSATQCYSDTPGFSSSPNDPDSWDDLVGGPDNPDLRIPGELADQIPGPPVPPPYTLAAPTKGYGLYYPSGDAACALNIAGQGPTDPCTIQTFCFTDQNAVLGPNLIWVLYMGDPLDTGAAGQTAGDGKTQGVIDIYYNQANSTCKALMPKGTVSSAANDTTFWLTTDKAGTPGTSAPWRVANPHGSSNPTLDFDGDGCTDQDELDKTSVAKCGDDPFNPSDSFDSSTVDLSGTYDSLARVVPADCSDPQDCINTLVGGAFGRCRAYLDHDTSDDSVSWRFYCLRDTPTVEINPEAFPGLTGDGFAGGPPPGPESSPGNGLFAFGDVNSSHAEFTGTFNRVTNEISLSGCWEDVDGEDPLGNIYLNGILDANQRPSTFNAHYMQSLSNCQNGTPSTPATVEDIFLVKQPGGAARDNDQDGVPDSQELQDDPVCGQRDPFNPFDYYDVSIPRDGIIDLTNDIFDVIQHYAPTGTEPQYDVNFDRPPTMVGGAGHWNRGSPDGFIDLSNDILGVIQQYNPDGC